MYFFNIILKHIMCITCVHYCIRCVWMCMDASYTVGGHYSRGRASVIEQR